MKKLIFLGIIFCVILFSCENLDSNNSIPILRDPIVGISTSAVVSGNETSTFKLGNTVYFGFTVVDDDLDVDKIILTQSNGSMVIGPDSLELPKQETTTQFYVGNILAMYDGYWTVEAYCVDKKGNKSNTISKNISITIEGVTIYTIRYDINGGVGETPVDNRKYTSLMTTIMADSSGFYKQNYTFLYWSTKRNGNRVSGSLPGEGIGLGKPGETIFYAVWKKPIDNIQHTSILSENIHNFTITWNEPQNINFSHVILDIFQESSYTPKEEFIPEVIIEKGILQYNFNYSWFDFNYYPYIHVGLTLIDEQGFPTNKLEYRINCNNNTSMVNE